VTSWALSLRREQASALAKLHNLSGVEVGEANGLVWARGTGTDEDVARILASLPTSRFFEIVHRDRLRPRGRLLPTGRLPEVRWLTVSQWLSIRIPPAALPGELSRTAVLTLALGPGRSIDAHEVLLLCGVEAFREFLLLGPLHRVRPLRFVVNDASSEVLVRGRPLPSVPGERYVLADGIATPAGYRWSPSVGASVVRSWLGLGDGAIALWRADGGISEIREDAFASASRRAGRKL